MHGQIFVNLLKIQLDPVQPLGGAGEDVRLRVDERPQILNVFKCLWHRGSPEIFNGGEVKLWRMAVC